MRDDDPAFGNLGGHLRQDRSNVLVRQAVETVSLQTRFANVPWQWNELRDFSVRAPWSFYFVLSFLLANARCFFKFPLQELHH